MFADILSLTPCCGCPGTDITVFDGRRARIPMGEVRCLRHNAPVCGWSLARPGTRVATAGRSVRRHYPGPCQESCTAQVSRRRFLFRSEKRRTASPEADQADDALDLIMPGNFSTR